MYWKFKASVRLIKRETAYLNFGNCFPQIIHFKRVSQDQGTIETNAPAGQIPSESEQVSQSHCGKQLLALVRWASPRLSFCLGMSVLALAGVWTQRPVWNTKSPCCLTVIHPKVYSIANETSTPQVSYIFCFLFFLPVVL